MPKPPVSCKAVTLFVLSSQSSATGRLQGPIVLCIPKPLFHGPIVRFVRSSHHAQIESRRDPCTTRFRLSCAAIHHVFRSSSHGRQSSPSLLVRWPPLTVFPVCVEIRIQPLIHPFPYFHFPLYLFYLFL